MCYFGWDILPLFSVPGPRLARFEEKRRDGQKGDRDPTHPPNPSRVVGARCGPVGPSVTRLAERLITEAQAGLWFCVGCVGWRWLCVGFPP